MNEELLSKYFRANARGMFKRKGYPYDVGVDRINIIGVRASGGATNTFNDLIVVERLIAVGETSSELARDTYAATTDPGTYWLNNPERIEGTAILLPGHYRGSHAVGYHQGRYRALTQRGKMRFVRDADRNADININPSKAFSDTIGCNIHLAREGSGRVDKWSAACQVIYGEERFDHFMRIVDKHIAAGWGLFFDYTLFDEADFDEAQS